MDTWNLIPMHSDFIFERHNWSHLFKYFPGLYKFGIFRNNQSGLPTSPSNSTMIIPDIKQELIAQNIIH